MPPLYAATRRSTQRQSVRPALRLLTSLSLRNRAAWAFCDRGGACAVSVVWLALDRRSRASSSCQQCRIAVGQSPWQNGRRGIPDLSQDVPLRARHPESVGSSRAQIHDRRLADVAAWRDAKSDACAVRLQPLYASPWRDQGSQDLARVFLAQVPTRSAPIFPDP